MNWETAGVIATIIGSIVAGVLMYTKWLIKDNQSWTTEKLKTAGELAETKLSAMKDDMQRQLDYALKTAEEAMEKGRSIETNYTAKFKETNSNVAETRELMLVKFGEATGEIQKLYALITTGFDHVKELIRHGEA